MARLIQTSIAIAAPPERVWAVLMDFADYPSWNPFIQSLQGEARVGAPLTATITPPGRNPQTFHPTIIALEPQRVFAWRGTLPIPGLFTGEHRFVLERSAAGTVFTQSERFTGVLVPLVGRILAVTEQGFHAMNEALKARAEDA
jgi:hypothetical protein